MSLHHRAAREAILSMSLLGVVVIALSVSHQHPARIVTRIRDVWRDGVPMTSRELATTVLVVLLWLIVFSWGVRTALVIVRLSRAATKTLFHGVVSRRGLNKVRLVLLFFLGAVSASKATTVGLDETELANSGISPVPLRGAMQYLPALASAGLAVGLSTHIQRERVALLRDAPVSARLKTPGRSALSRGVAVFERSSEWSNQQAPAGAMFLPVGVDGSQLVHISVLPGDLISVEASDAQASTVLRHLLNTIALAPWLSEPRVVLCGFDPNDVVQSRNITIARSASDASNLALSLRADHPNAAIFVVARSPAVELESLASRGITVIFGHCDPDARGRPVSEKASPATRIVRTEHAWHIDSQNQYFLPYGVTPEEAADFRIMVREMTVLDHDTRPRTQTEETPTVVTRPTPTPYAMVRILGSVEVLVNGSTEVRFQKAKSLELLCWLCFHRDRPTVSGARTALWEVDVEDATFHNVLSELRRGLMRCGLGEAVRRETKHRLTLDGRVTTDVDVLRHSLIVADESPSPAAIAELVDVLMFVRGLPFLGRSYAWADAEGITSTVVWLVTRAIELAVEVAKSHGDDATVLDATAAGLRMLPNDEYFLGLQRSAMGSRFIDDGGVAPSPSQSPVASTR